jgi:hypothetical protein
MRKCEGEDERDEGKRREDGCGKAKAQEQMTKDGYNTR